MPAKGDAIVGATPASPASGGTHSTGDAGVAPAKNLAMLLTAPQPAAIAVVRLSGPLIESFAATHLSRAPKQGRCVHCDLHDGGETIDDIVAVLAGPDRLDLNLHGGPWVTEAALRLAERFGFELTSWRDAAAVASDAVNEIDAEVAAALPFAATREALAILLAQPAAWEELLSGGSAESRRRALADRTIERILRPPTVAIVGEPNAGKSTLLNTLAGQARSITADVPGTTRDYVTTPANLAGLLVNLIDTPGHRETTDPIEAAAIAQAQTVIDRADVVIELRDVLNPPPSAPRPRAIVVFNKCDQAPAPAGEFAISAASAQGVDHVIAAVLRQLGVEDLSSRHARAWTARQRQILSLSLGQC